MNVLGYCWLISNLLAASCPVLTSGRVVHNRLHPEQLLLSWGMTTVTTQFVGTGLTAFLWDEHDHWGDAKHRNQFDVVIDGQSKSIITASAKASDPPLVVAEHLAPGRHTLALVKRTEALVGTSIFAGFVPQAGGHCLSPPPAHDFIEIIGDSISTGYGNLGKNAACHFTPASQDGPHAYGPLLAAKLGLDVHVIAWSGRGLWRNLDGSLTETLPELWGRGQADDATSIANFAGKKPLATIINLGTNDFKRGVPNASLFTANMHSLLARVRQRAPLTWIIVCLGPMLDQKSKRLPAARSLLKQAIGPLMISDHRLLFVEFPEQIISQGTGCDYHPNLKKHAQMAAQLQRTLALLPENSLIRSK